MQDVFFKAHQWAELKALDLPDRVIAEIERCALPFAKRILEHRPRKNDVVEELKSLLAALKTAHSSMEGFLTDSHNTPARAAALWEVNGGDGPDTLGGIRLAQALKPLTVAVHAVEGAIQRMPSGPVRHRAADPHPIKLIVGALDVGWLVAGGQPGGHGIRPSTSPTSRFRRLIGTCYEAMDQGSGDPIRAIKAYVARYRAVEAFLVRQGLSTERGRKT